MTYTEGSVASAPAEPNALPGAPEPTYSVVGELASPSLARFVDALAAAIGRAGFEPAAGSQSADLVINVIDPDRPRPFRRRARGTFVAALVPLPERPPDVLSATYPLLVRALANVVLAHVPGGTVWFTTLERGSYPVGGDGVEALAEQVSARLVPLARARLVIDNEFRSDLEPELWIGDELTEEIRDAGRRLGELDLLPAPFPVERLLGERDLRHMRRLYGIGGLSYGNLSARKDEQRFWMSASGVDKTKLEVPGQDILLVSGYDADRGRMILSVPPGLEPRRVSVDAIEHWMIYWAVPDADAILHVHAWVDGVAATEVNYPCGTEELARSVAALVVSEPNPAEAVVGLRNHGITATGPSLGAILDRIEPRLRRQVPMT